MRWDQSVRTWDEKCLSVRMDPYIVKVFAHPGIRLHAGCRFLQAGGTGAARPSGMRSATVARVQPGWKKRGKQGRTLHGMGARTAGSAQAEHRCCRRSGLAVLALRIIYRQCKILAAVDDASIAVDIEMV
jgi:hypothetical protein